MALSHATPISHPGESALLERGKSSPRGKIRAAMTGQSSVEPISTSPRQQQQLPGWRAQPERTWPWHINHRCAISWGIPPSLSVKPVRVSDLDLGIPLRFASASTRMLAHTVLAPSVPPVGRLRQRPRTRTVSRTKRHNGCLSCSAVQKGRRRLTASRVALATASIKLWRMMQVPVSRSWPLGVPARTTTSAIC